MSWSRGNAAPAWRGLGRDSRVLAGAGGFAVRGVAADPR
jgi:hypothetical protein